MSRLRRLVPGRPTEPVELTGEGVPTGGRVRGVEGWVVGQSRGEDFAVSRRCRHQFADLAGGHVDADGCLVCPWHASRYDVRTGDMVDGPKGFLTYRGPAPGYSGMVRAYAKVWRLKVGRIVRRGTRVFVEESGS